MIFGGKTGGLLYHGTAYRYQKLWASHLEATSAWLETWVPSSDHLVLLGPSAGYSLPDHFLKRFRHITAIDLDPWASWFFKRQHPDLSPHWIRQNYFSKEKTLNPTALLELKSQFPEAAFLFCNLLGQLPLQVGGAESTFELWKSHLHHDLQDTSWASFHDVWSTVRYPTAKNLWRVPCGASLEDSIRHFFSREPLLTKAKKSQHTERKWFREQIKIDDHGTFLLFRNQMGRWQWMWQIRPGRFHCIEGVLSAVTKQEDGA